MHLKKWKGTNAHFLYKEYYNEYTLYKYISFSLLWSITVVSWFMNVIHSTIPVNMPTFLFVWWRRLKSFPPFQHPIWFSNTSKFCLMLWLGEKKKKKVFTNQSIIVLDTTQIKGRNIYFWLTVSKGSDHSQLAGRQKHLNGNTWQNKIARLIAVKKQRDWQRVREKKGPGRRIHPSRLCL